MCGISGTVRQSADGPALVQNLLRLQHRRGPDHSQWLERTLPAEQLTFGHNRLAILDLDARSNQPFVDEKTNQLLVYNGEIYNYLELKTELSALGHEFHTTGDTEVVLKAYQQWDVEAFSKFNGFFAFALYDPKRERTLLVRDRFGVKPLYYHWQNARLTFASNPAALAKTVGAGLNMGYLALGVRFDIYEGMTLETPYTGVISVPAGEYLIFSHGECSRKVYYDLAARVDGLAERLREQTLHENLNELRDLMLSATELRLRSDVPTTLSLSGGLDSGLCAWLMREVSQKSFTAFTFAKPDWAGSEAALAQITADYLGVTLKYAAPTDLVKLFDATLEAQGAPYSDPSGLAQQAVFSEIHQAGYKVSLGGQGADEGFCGYRKFQLSAMSELRQRRKWGELMAHASGTALTLWHERNSPQNYLQRFLKSRRQSEPAFFSGDLALPQPFANPTDLRARQVMDVQHTSLPTLLRCEDANSMYYSIESRMPFLDYRVMEFGLALPLDHKIRGGHGKYILRRLAEGKLPERIVWDRNKRAFSLDPSLWLGGGLGANLFARVQAAKNRLYPLLSDEARAQVEEPEFFLQRKNYTKITTLIYLLEHQI